MKKDSESPWPVGRCVEAGDDASGQPRILIHTTRSELMKGRNLVFQDCAVMRADEIASGDSRHGSALLTRLYNHRAMMAPHQKERHTGKLLLECIAEIERLNQNNRMPLKSESVPPAGSAICKICGEREYDHHEPEWLEMPAGCVCDFRTWNYDNKTALPPACGEYKGEGKQNCQTCEHDQACHTGRRSDSDLASCGG